MDSATFTRSLEAIRVWEFRTITTPVQSCKRLRAAAIALFRDGKYAEAQLKYGDAIKAVVSVEIPLPVTEGMRNEVYMNLDWWGRIELMTCFNGMARCMEKLGDLNKALEWLHEIDAISKNGFFSESANFDWINYNLDMKDYFVQRISGFKLASTLFLELGNTGAAVQQIIFGYNTAVSAPPHVDRKSVLGIVNLEDVHSMIKFRHPDPSLLPTLCLRDSELQVRGSWQKIKLTHPRRIQSRMGFFSFWYNGHLYVGGGMKDAGGPWHRDFWRLNIQKFDAWHELPSCPVRHDAPSTLRGFSMAVHKDKAYMFTGRQDVDFFDLITNQWGYISTSFKREDGKPGLVSWPYAGGELSEYTMQIVDGRMYVFGGTNYDVSLGCDLLIVLDIATRQWTRLSGTVKPRPDHLRPGPRSFPASWVNKNQDTIFVMFGVAEPSHTSYSYDDVWSWSIPDGHWRRERITGNAPCSRSEMAYTYNSSLDRTIMYGGYNAKFPVLWADETYIDGYSYYGDTFISYPTTSDSPLKWKHVLTRGFPSYRAQAQLISDPSTGKTFLFGGYTGRGMGTSGSSNIISTFGDIWQLCIDIPGGFFEGVDFDEESRTAKPGPWQRCFTCAAVGASAKKCGGTCKGRAFFCDSECLAAGWKEHKRMHGCRKP